MFRPFAARLRDQLGPGRFGRQISLTLAQTIAESGALTVAVFLVAGIFGPALFGVLGVFLVGVQLVTMIIEGIWASQVKSVSECAAAHAQPAAARVGWRSVWWTTLLSLAFCLAVAAVYTIYDPAFMAANVLPVFLTLLVAVTRVAKSSLEAVCRGLRDFATPARWGIALSPVQMILLIGAAWAGYRINAYLLIMAITQAINVLALSLAFHRRYRHPAPAAAGPPLVGMAEILRYSVPLVLRGVVAFLLLKINIPMIASIAGTVEVGHYRLAEQFLTLAMLVMGAVINAFAPRVANHIIRGEREQLAWVVGKTYGLLFIVLAPLTLLFLLNGFLVRPLFPDYEPAIAMIQCFGALLILRGFSFISTGGLLPQGGYAGTAFLLAAGGAAVNIVVVYFATHWCGAYGAVLATTAVQIIMSLAMIITGHVVLKLPFRIRLV